MRNDESICERTLPPAPDGAYSPLPYTDSCAEIVGRGEHVVIGLSPFNGYFTPNAVRRLVFWGVDNFRCVNVLLPGYEAIYTLVAAGMTPVDASRRLRKSLYGLRNTSVRCLRERGIADADQRVHTWTRLTERNSYLCLRRRVEKHYDDEPWLRQACQQEARTAVANSGGAEPEPGAPDHAVRYALAELPFFIDSPSIYGVASSVFAYPRPVQLIETLISRPDALARGRGQGFVSFPSLP